MPSCLLTDRTVLQTPKGWCAVKDETSIREVVGVNNQGGHSISPVTIEIAHEDTMICYLGTRATFSGFHPETKLVTAAGLVKKASAIVAHDIFKEVDFELAADFPSVDTNLDAVWNQLSLGAAVKRPEELLYRVMSDTTLPASLRTDWLSVKNESDNRYALILKQGLLPSLKRLGVRLLWDLLAFIYLRESSLTFDRKNYVFALWCATYLDKTRQKYGLTYDSIQHSATLTVDLRQKSTRIEQIRSAFVADQGRVVRLRWSTRQWYPVAGGFAVVD